MYVKSAAGDAASFGKWLAQGLFYLPGGGHSKRWELSQATLGGREGFKKLILSRCDAMKHQILADEICMHDWYAFGLVFGPADRACSNLWLSSYGSDSVIPVIYRRDRVGECGRYHSAAQVTSKLREDPKGEREDWSTIRRLTSLRYATGELLDQYMIPAVEFVPAAFLVPIRRIASIRRGILQAGPEVIGDAKWGSAVRDTRQR